MSAPTPAPAKICHVCHKDVSNAKRVKDPAGHYFCQECYDHAAHATPAGVAKGGDATAKAPHVPAAKPMSVKVTTPPPPKDEYDFNDPPPAPKPKVAVPAPAPVGNASSKLPEFCPHCGMKVVGGRKLCVGGWSGWAAVRSMSASATASNFASADGANGRAARLARRCRALGPVEACGVETSRRQVGGRRRGRS